MSIVQQLWNAIPQKNPHLDELLKREHIDLDDVLDEESVIYEIRDNNEKILQVLTGKEHFEQLIRYATRLPDPCDFDHRKMYKFPFISCEILSTGNARILNMFFNSSSSENAEFAKAAEMQDDIVTHLDDEEDMKKENLDHKFLEMLFEMTNEKENGKLNLVLTGYFSRIIGSIIEARQKELLDFVFQKKKVEPLLDHLYSNSICTIVLNLIGVEELNKAEGEPPRPTIYLNERLGLLENILKSFEQETSEEALENISEMVCSLLSKTKEINGAKEIQNFFEQKSTLAMLFEPLYKKGLGYIKHFGPILMTLIQTSPLFHIKDLPPGQELRESGADATDATASENEEKIIAKFLDKFLTFVTSSIDSTLGAEKSVMLQHGLAVSCVGAPLIKLLELLNSLSAMDSTRIHYSIQKSNILPKILSLMIRNPENNIAHVQIEKIIRHCLTSGSLILIRNLFEDVRLINFIIENTKEQEYQINSKMKAKCRKGYVAFLIRIANTIVDVGQINVKVREYMNESWDVFVKEVLEPTNTRDTTLIGGEDPKANYKDTHPRESIVDDPDSIDPVNEPIVQGRLSYHGPEETKEGGSPGGGESHHSNSSDSSPSDSPNKMSEEDEWAALRTRGRGSFGLKESPSGTPTRNDAGFFEEPHKMTNEDS